MSEPLLIRRAEPGDLTAIVAIYNHYVTSGVVTFDLEPWQVETRRHWLAGFLDQGPYQMLVAIDGAGNLLGYAYSAQFRTRAAYDRSVETTAYLHAEHTGRGYGRTLYERLFEELAKVGIHRAYAGITLPNEVSVALHERFGFTPCGVWTEAGYKFDRYWDVGLFEKRMDA